MKNGVNVSAKMNEYKKALEDMLIFGTGIVQIKDNAISHVPFQETINPECEHDWQKGKHLFTNTFCTKCHEVKE